MEEEWKESRWMIDTQLQKAFNMIRDNNRTLWILFTKKDN